MQPYCTSVIKAEALTLEDLDNDIDIVSRGDLPPECKILYDRVAGENISVDNLDFPLAETILKSINNENGWCQLKIREKL